MTVLKVSSRSAQAGLSESELDQLMQLFYRSPVWDGNLISKSARTKFKEMGYVWKDDNGNNYLTDEGMDYAAPIADSIDWSGG